MHVSLRQADVSLRFEQFQNVSLGRSLVVPWARLVVPSAHNVSLRVVPSVLVRPSHTVSAANEASEHHRHTPRVDPDHREVPDLA